MRRTASSRDIAPKRGVVFSTNRGAVARPGAPLPLALRQAPEGMQVRSSAIWAAWFAAASVAACSLDTAGLGGRDGGGERVDGRVTVPDGCVPSVETCNGRDDDCNGRVDETFDLTTDLANCGRCGSACSTDPANAASTCAAATCALACDPGFADCNGAAADGCETALSDPRTCGGCAAPCSGAVPFCEPDGAGSWGCVATCAGGLMECGASCVDVTSDPAHCGACTVTCPTPAHTVPTCAGGSCGFSCDPGWADCDASGADGCEASLTSTIDCGACGAACMLANALASCSTGTCLLGSCSPGFGDCNGSPTDGCEADLSADATCGDCATACTGALPVCSTASGVPLCASACGPGEMLCAGTCVAVTTDPLHCGSCAPCPVPPGAAATCAGATCGYACDPGLGDCNAMSADGCEADVTSSVANCGACGRACAPAHAAGACAAGACAIASCDLGYFDCDRSPANGCESLGPCCTAAACTGCSGFGTCCARACGTASCDTTCTNGCACNVSCAGNLDTCTLRCDNGATCSIDCTAGNECYVDCQRGAQCLLDCTAASDCRFTACSGGMMSCAGDVVVCNRSCPP